MSPPSVHSLDIAERNLACAVGLLRTGDLDTSGLLGVLDHWAATIRSETGRLAYLFHRNPADHHHSFSRFRMALLATVLQRDFGVHYSLNSLDMPDAEFFARPEHLFIHSAIQGSGGTCSSLPVIFVAVGRRLGYPLSLVHACQHVLARWEGPGERFNIECTSRGFVSHPDEYYLNWPRKISLAQASENGLLQSLTTEQETASFYSQRGQCFEANGNWMDATFSHAGAVDFDPLNRCYRDDLHGALARWAEEQAARLPPGFPPLRIRPRLSRFPRVPLELHIDIGFLLGRHILLSDPEAERRFWSPLRHNADPRPRVPAMIEVDLTGPPGREVAIRLHDWLPADFNAAVPFHN